MFVRFLFHSSVRVAGCCRFLSPWGLAGLTGAKSSSTGRRSEWVASSLQDPYWWQWLPHRVPTVHQEQFWASVSCSRILRHVAQSRPRGAGEPGIRTSDLPITGPPAPSHWATATPTNGRYIIIQNLNRKYQTCLILNTGSANLSHYKIICAKQHVLTLHIKSSTPRLAINNELAVATGIPTTNVYTYLCRTWGACKCYFFLKNISRRRANTCNKWPMCPNEGQIRTLKVFTPQKWAPNRLIYSPNQILKIFMQHSFLQTFLFAKHFPLQ